MITQEQATQFLELALKASDADDVNVSVHCGAYDSIRVADNITTQNIHKEDSGFNVSCAYGQSHASASANKLTPESIRALVQRAQEAAKLSPPDPEYVPPVTPDEAGTYPEIDGWCEDTSTFEPELMAERIEGGIKLVQKRGLRLSGGWSQQSGFSAFASSSGLSGSHRSTSSEIHTTVLGDAGSGWAQQTATSRNDIDVDATVLESLQIATEAQNPTDIEPGKYTVILRPAAVQEMLPYYMIQDAKATDEGRTFLRDKLGQKVCDEKVTIRSNPTDPRCPGSPYCKGGLAAEPVDWVREGVLKNLDYSRYWAKEKGKAATPGPSNLIMDGGDQSVEDLIASTERGIFVVRFWYIRIVDPMTSLLTGMTRDGLFLIEDGKITRPLKQLRFNEKVLTALSNVEALGPVERVGHSLMPTLKIRDFTFSSSTNF